MFSPDKSVLIVVDVQGKLATLMHEKEDLFSNIKGLIQAAHLLAIPVLMTEQVPEKIGSTIEEIRSLVSPDKIFSKETFSCYGEKDFVTTLRGLYRKQIIVCGIETHVCIYQTVFDLIQNSFKVQLVVDAISSRDKLHKDVALQRMEKLGADLTTTEMLLTELIRTSAHPKFKEILHFIR